MEVDVSNQRDVWLVKVPKYLANEWNNVASGSSLGKLLVPKNNSGPVKFISDQSIQQKSAKQDAAKVPSEHSLTLHTLTDQSMFILAQNKEPPTGNVAEKLYLEGEVKHRGELRPNADMSYMNLKASSIRNAAKPVRTAQILDKAVTSYKPRGAAQLAHEADLRKKKDEARKVVREDKEIVQGRLFSAFEKQQYYSIKDLVRITGQSIPYLKEILKEICHYCSTGTHKNMWELKPEFRHYKTSTSKK